MKSLQGMDSDQVCGIVEGHTRIMMFRRNMEENRAVIDTRWQEGPLIPGTFFRDPLSISSHSCPFLVFVAICPMSALRSTHEHS